MQQNSARTLALFAHKQTSPWWLQCLENGQHKFIAGATGAAGCNKPFSSKVCVHNTLKVGSTCWLKTTLTILANCKLHTCVNRLLISEENKAKHVINVHCVYNGTTQNHAVLWALPVACSISTVTQRLRHTGVDLVHNKPSCRDEWISRTDDFSHFSTQSNLIHIYLKCSERKLSENLSEEIFLSINCFMLACSGKKKSVCQLQHAYVSLAKHWTLIAPKGPGSSLHGSSHPLICDCVCEWVNKGQLSKALVNCEMLESAF